MGTVQCIAGCLTTSLVLTHEMPVATVHSRCDNQNISRYFQMSLAIELPQLRTSGLEETEGSRQNVAHVHLLPLLQFKTSFTVFHMATEPLSPGCSLECPVLFSPFWVAGPWAEASGGSSSTSGIMSCLGSSVEHPSWCLASWSLCARAADLGTGTGNCSSADSGLFVEAVTLSSLSQTPKSSRYLFLHGMQRPEVSPEPQHFSF